MLQVIEKTGRVLHTVDLGDEYGFVDIDGKHGNSEKLYCLLSTFTVVATLHSQQTKAISRLIGLVLLQLPIKDQFHRKNVSGRSPPNIRSVSDALRKAGWVKTSQYIPSFVKVPGWVLTAVYSKL